MNRSLRFPRYVTARHASAEELPVTPPFSFEGVTVRAFPLKANMYRLRRFCDQYLNLAPGILSFRPALPYVYLMVLDYGKMAVDAANFGWIAQREITFTIPLEWYRTEVGRPRFHDFASISPFIFVDDQVSLTTGREVYGWPKTFGWMTPELGRWVSDPRAGERLMRMSTMVFPRVYAGERQEPRPLLEIERDPPARLLELPPDTPRLLRALPDALGAWLAVMRDGLELAAGLPITGYARRNAPGALVDRSLRALAQANVFSPDLCSNQVNVKQFRDAEHPERFCYQAITNSVMGIRRYNDGGMLGEGGLLRGDPSGGFRIHLHRYRTQPIIESLGIEVAEEREAEGHTVSTLRPTLPFWLDMDLDYGVGEALCWRAQGVPAVDPRTAERAPARVTPWRVAGGDGAERVVGEPPDADAGRFNTARGAAVQNLAGPFVFPDMTVRVLPLLADPERLAAFCRAYADIGGPHRFEPCGRFVYVLVSTFDTMASERDNIGNLDHRELEFALPVRWYHRNARGEERLVSLALLSPFVFCENSTLAITEREVLGRNTVAATLASPGDRWMDGRGPTAERDHLRVRAEVFPVLGMGQRAEHRTLIEITQEDVLREGDGEGWKQVMEGWGATLVGDHERKRDFAAREPALCADARALAIEFLALQGTLNCISLKQLRDSAEPGRACYQALVHTPRRIERVFDLREMEERLHLRIHRYPDHPIAETLGLVAKHTDTAGGRIVDTFQPLRPFWARLSMRQQPSTNLCWRAGAAPEGEEPWHPAGGERPPRGLYFTGGKGPDGSPRPCAGAELAAAVDGERIPTGQDAPATLKQNLPGVARRWLEETSAGTGSENRLTLERARSVLEKLEPHLLVESILSREWMNWGNPRWFRELQRRRANHEQGDFLPTDAADFREFRMRADSFGWRRLASVRAFHERHGLREGPEGFCAAVPEASPPQRPRGTKPPRRTRTPRP